MLGETPLDVLIVGGGINGAGIARDLGLRAAAAGRALRIGLVDKRHFGSGTSSRNSQLIHGGLRYLKYLEFRLVREALRERATLLRIAPHLVEPLSLLIPFYNARSRYFYGAGLWLYDLLAGSRNIGRRRYFSRNQVAAIEPNLDVKGLHSAAIYYDCTVNSARGVLENIFDAARAGVIVANYTEAGKPGRQGDGFEVELADAEGGQRFAVQTRRLVDARGPWEGSANVRLVRGSHIVVPRLNASDNAIAYFGPDGRIVFIIPWGAEKKLSLVGTTDVDHESSADDVRISAKEIGYLIEVVRRLFPRSGNVTPIAAYSSLRPLAAAGASGSATAASRDHRIWMENGIVKIAGGKYTTYRAMSAEAVELLAREIAPELAGRSETAARPLGGNSMEAFSALKARGVALARQHGLEPDEVAMVIRSHGLQAGAVFALLPAGGAGGWSRMDLAVMRYAVRHEMARKLADVMFVSTYWGHERMLGAAQLQALADAMGQELGWSPARVAEEVENTLNAPVMPGD